jgi:hypothetical protein
MVDVTCIPLPFVLLPPFFFYSLRAPLRERNCCVAPRSIIEFGLFLYIVFCLACLVCHAVHSQSLVIPIRERLRAAVAITHRVSPFAKCLRSMASKTTKLNHERRIIAGEKQDEAKGCRDRTTFLLKYAIGLNFFSSSRQAKCGIEIPIPANQNAQNCSLPPPWDLESHTS